MFYIPTPVPFVACAVSVGLLLKNAPRRALLAALLSVTLATHWAVTEVKWVRPGPDEVPGTEISGSEISGSQTLRLVHWNVFRNYLPWKYKIDRLRRLEGDVYVLNEVPREVTRGNWALKLGPGMDYAMGQLMVVACRGRVLNRELETEPGLITLWVECAMHPPEPLESMPTEAALGQNPRVLSILAVDMSADPLMARDPVLARLVAKIGTRKPDLIAGDFNAPRRSRRLQQLPAGYRHAYETVGRGWPYTWPVPLPLLAIDQCIFGPHIAPTSFHYRTGSSDHRLQVFGFEIRR